MQFGLTQNIRVLDTQPPIITVPGGFTYESAEQIEFDAIDEFIGRPRIVDLADARPTFERTELSQLEPDHRYEIYWTATDSSNNTSAPQLQLVTIKTPGTNTPAIADPLPQQETITGELLEITLSGTDTDEIDGRVDPLNFEIASNPQKGFLESPLYPFFIQDYRLSPVGAHEEIQANEVVRTSPLLGLAEGFSNSLLENQGTYLQTNICNAEPGALHYSDFNNVIPVNFVFEPKHVQVDDEGFYYVLDSFWKCGSSRQYIEFDRGIIDPIPRISKWDSEGNFIAMQELVPIEGGSYAANTLDVSRLPEKKFSFDEYGRIWIATRRNYVSFSWSGTYFFHDYLFSDVRLLSLSSQFTQIYSHGDITVNYQSYSQGEEYVGIAVDREREIFYDLRGWGFKPLLLQNTEVLREDLPVYNDGPLGPVDTTMYKGYKLIPGCQPPNNCYNSGSSGYNYNKRAATDIEIDNEGYVYILHTSQSRIYKYKPPTENSDGSWKPGDFIGWMGRCDANLQNANNEFYNACDIDKKVSRGFACGEEKCSWDASSGSLPGQFNLPEELVFDDNDILYVADTGNKRIQRFGRDGTFAGEATSSGEGFVLGNFDAPKSISVNSKGFYLLETDIENSDYFLHVFETLPFWDMTESSATVRYRSEFGHIGTDQFSFLVDDGLVKSDPVAVDINVARAYNPPTDLVFECFGSVDLTEAGACELNEDAALYIRVSSMDRDGFLGAEGLDSHSFVIEVEPGSGQLTIEDDFTSDNTVVYRYNPNADYNGDDSFSFYAVDEQEEESFTLRSEQTLTVDLTIFPVPDKIAVDTPSSIQVPRGFTSVIAFPYLDVDQADHSNLLSFNWGDGSAVITDFSQYRVPGSGHFDNEGREINPLIDAANGSGVLVASHLYLAATSGNLQISLSNTDFADQTYADSVISIPIDLVETTQLAVINEHYLIQPDEPFDLQLSVTNRRPEGWTGMPAPNAQLSFVLPEGLELTELDSRCTESEETQETLEGEQEIVTVISCQVVAANSALAVDQIVNLDFTALVTLETAREELGFVLDVELTDDAPKIHDVDISLVTIEVIDTDDDGVVDALDKFPTDPRYSYDSDNDGMADDWETQFGLNNEVNDSADDIDEDGLSNLAEFVAGTSPRLANTADNSTFLKSLGLESNYEDLMGFRVSSGDFNADGNADLVAVAPQAINANADVSGTARIYFGDGHGNFNRDFAGNILMTAEGVDLALGSNDYDLGRALAVGDFDNNGYDDIAVAMNWYSEIPAVKIFLNDATGLGANTKILEDYSNTYTAIDSLAAGDIDDDGIDDLLFGQVDYSEEIAINVGAVFVYLAVDGYLQQNNPQASVIVAGVFDSAAIGSSISMGDLDGDDNTDLVIGAGNSGANPGRVYIYLGKDLTWSLGGVDVPSLTLPSPRTINDRFGYSVAANADVDGDGKDDILVGAYSVAEAYLYLSSYGYLQQDFPAVSVTISGESGSQFGVSVAFVENIVPDIYADAVIGANSVDNTSAVNVGSVFVYRGSASGLMQHSAYEGDTANGHLGYWVSGAGDVNSDGLTDFVAGQPGIGSGTGGEFLLYLSGGNATETDADYDFVGDNRDNCLGEPNSDQLNIDNDAFGNNCDNDIDGDQLANEDDNCPLIANVDQLNTDGDDEGDICDEDDDADSVADVDDAFPLNPNYAIDTDGDGLPDEWEIAQGLNENDGSDADLDSDMDGQSNLNEFLNNNDPNVDDVAPGLVIPGNISVASTGPLTYVDLGEGSAEDARDGIVPAMPNSSSVFRPGRHSVEWQASDDSGNTAVGNQRVDVLPMVSLNSVWQQVPEGKTITLTALLNGNAPVYPVTIPLSFGGTASENDDYFAESNVIVIEEGRTGSITLEILDDAVDDDGETILVSTSGATNAVNAEGAFSIAITNQQVAPYVQLSMTQFNESRTTIVRDDGEVTLYLDAISLDDDNLEVTADSPDIDLTLQEIVGNRYHYSFDPATLEAGIYSIAFTVSDNASPQNFVEVRKSFRMVAAIPDLYFYNDSDGDGISDAEEGLLDINENGVNDYLELFVDTNLLPASSTRLDVLLQSRAGLGMKLGLVSLSSGNDAMVTMEDISSFGNVGAIATNVGDDEYNYPLGLFDFEIEGLAAGEEVANVVIALDAGLPANAVYRKYVAELGWQDFEIDTFNAVASAPGALQTCPQPGHSSYRTGLNEGDRCVQLTLEDGGLNDADMERNYRIVDPSGIGVPVGSSSSSSGGSDGSSSGGNGSGGKNSGGGGSPDGMLILILMMALGSMAKKYRQSAL